MFRKKMYAFSSKDNDGKTLIYLVSARSKRRARKRVDMWGIYKDLELIDESRANFMMIKLLDGHTELIFPQGSIRVKAE